MTHTTAHVLPAHWPEEVKAAFWTAVNAPTTVQAAAATLAFAERLAAPVSSPADPTGLRDRIAAAMREHWLSTTRDEADADGNLPCRCGEWREPGAEADDENDWESHLADAVLAVLPSPADRAAVPHDVELLHVVDAYLTATHVARHDVIGVNGSCAGCQLRERLRVGLRRVADEEQPTQTPCGCGHAADEHSVYGCIDGCDCDRMFKRPPMDPVHILGIGAADARPVVGEQPNTPETRRG